MVKHTGLMWFMVSLLLLVNWWTAAPCYALTGSGSLTEDETWSGLIEIAGDVTVPAGFTLTIKQGSLIRFPTNAGLHIHGRLNVTGTDKDPITFTSSSTSPGRGSWSGIYFYDSSLDVSVIDHGVIEYASRGLWCNKAHPALRNSLLANNLIGVYLSDSSSLIIGCIIRDNQEHGIYLERSCSPWIANNHIARCNNGVYVSGGYQGSPTIRNNIIRSNVGYGIHVGSYYTPTITFNTLDVDGTGIYLATSSGHKSTLSSNIITSCNIGISRAHGDYTLSYNDFWDNGANTSGLSPGATDLALDPWYVDWLIADVRLQDGSPLLSAGQDGGEIGAFGAGGNPPLLTGSYSTLPTTSGSLTRNEIWSGLIEVTGNVTVPFGMILKLEPGTVLRFANNTGLHVYGRLEAVGSAANPITFTSSSTSPGRGSWSGIYFYDTSLDVSVIDHGVIEYASRGLWCNKAHPALRNSLLANNLIGVYLSDSSSLIIGCIIRDNQEHGIYLERSCSPWIANNHIARCNNGVYVSGGYQGSPTIRNNIIRSNVGYGIHVGSYYTPTITFNTLDVDGTGIYLATSSGHKSTLSSNIITSCNIGISRAHGDYTLSYNDFWDNGANTSGLSPGATDLALDPWYVDWLIADVRLQDGSPLLSAGQDGGEIGAFGAGGNPPLLTGSYSTLPTTSGSLTRNEIWSGLIEVTGNVTVPFGMILKLEPGTVLRFANNTGLHVYGRLEAVGSAANPITFTSSSTSPGRGSWSGIYFYDTSLDVSVIDHGVIEYASRGLWCNKAHPALRNSLLANNLIGVYLSDSSSLIIGCIIRDNQEHGIYLERSCSPWIANNHIARCNNGVYVSGGYQGSPTIRNNIIRSNVGYGIHVGSYYTPTITFNTLDVDGTGIYLATSSGHKSTLSSNIITSCNIGISRSHGDYTLSYNDLWNNQTNYSNLSPGGGDISSNPLFVASGDFHLQSGSSCIDAGDPFILDGDGTRADMGAYGGTGGPTATPGDTIPERPSNSLPADGALNLSASLILSASPFSDPDSGDFQASSRWQIRAASGSYSSPVFDSGETTANLTSIRIPWGTLEPGTAYFWRVRYKDNKNGWSDYSLETTFTTLKDHDAPDTTITSGPVEGGVTGSGVSFGWLGSDTAGEPLVYSFAIDFGEWSSFLSSTTFTFNSLAEGAHVFKVRARDYSGNVDLTPAVRNFTVDRSPPMISEVAVPRITNKSAVISWQTDEPATSQAVFGDSPSYGSGTAQDSTLVTVHTMTLLNLKADTQYHFAVKSKDGVGNLASSPNFTFRTLPAVDETPPETSIATGPPDRTLVNRAQITFGWTGWDDITETPRISYAYRLDLQPWSTFGSATSHTFSELIDGEHTLEVKARDEAGNEDSTPAIRIFTVDTTPPAPPANLLANSTPDGVTFHWTHSPSPDIHSYRLYGDQGGGGIDYSAVLAVVDYPAGSTAVHIPRKGVYRFGLRAVDRAGNEELNTSLTVTVSLTRPNAPVLQPVISPTDVGSQVIAGTKEVDTSLWLDGTLAVPLNQATSWSYQVALIEGVNRFQLTCRNEAGEESPPVAAIIDYESPPLPVSTLTASGNGPGTTVSLNWAGYDERGQGDIALYRIYVSDHFFSQVQGMSPAALLPAGTYAHTITGLVKGDTYYLAVVAVDVRGNALTAVSPVSAVPTDSVPPEDVTALSVECFSDRLVFTWNPSVNSGRDLSGYSVYFNRATAGIPVPINRNRFEQAGLVPATAYPCTVTAVDESGNESPGAAVEAITLLDNPANLIIQPQNGRLNFSWTDSQPRAYVARYHLYLSESNFTNVAGMNPRARLTGTSASIAGLTNEKTYYGAVTAVNLSGGEKQEVVAQSATPVGDKEGPTITDVRFDSEPLVSGMALRHSGTFSLTAADPSGMSRVEFRLDGGLHCTTTTATLRYYCPWDITQVGDGTHLLSITAYDTLGNVAARDTTLVVALDPPPPPTISYPSSGQLVKLSTISVSGRADVNAEVLIFDNNLQVGTAVKADSSGGFSLPLTLAEGENHLQAIARNRAGASPRSIEVIVTLDSTLPQSPTSVTASPRAGGMILLAWRAPSEAALRGFNVYRATTPFTTANGALKVNGTPLTATTFDDLPPVDDLYYYRISVVDRAGNESELSELTSAASDRTPPRALAIDYVPSDRFDPMSGRMSVGAVGVRVSVSEPLQAPPFLSITPYHGTPVTVDLNKSSDMEFSGMFSISQATPSGTAYAVFSGRDAVGNRGTAVDSGASLEIDTTGPTLTTLTVEPHAPIRNDANSPATMAVTFGLNEAVKPNTLPELSYLLSKAGRSPIAIPGLTRISAQSGQAQTFQAIFLLPADAGLTEVETLQFLYRGSDDLDNLSAVILAENRFQVYQGELPPLDAPAGFNAKALPAGRIHLSWTPRADASGYQLFRKAPGESALTEYLKIPNTAEWVDSPELDGKHRYAIASVRRENGQEAVGGMSLPVEVESDSQPPGPPRGLALELLSRGVNAVWQAPADPSEPVTYALYRADRTEIHSVEGLSTLITGIKETTVLDLHPSVTDHCYAVTALDRAGNESGPSNSFYLNCKLLPISSLRVVQHDGEAPQLTWTHPGGLGTGLVGFNLFLETGGERVKLNEMPLAALSYTDAGYSGEERVYTVAAVDGNGIESLGRSITLPVMRADLKAGEALERGVINRLEYVVQSGSASSFEHVRLKAKVGNHLHTSEEFRLEAGETSDQRLAAGGFADLAALSPLTTTIAITPNQGEIVEISHSGTINVADGMLILQILNDELTRGLTGRVQFTLENTGDEEIEIVTATASGTAASDEISFQLQDSDGNTLTTVPYQQHLGTQIVTLPNGTSVARIPAGKIFSSTAVDLPIPLKAPEQAFLRLSLAKIHFHQGKPDQVSMEGPATRQRVTFADTSYYGEISHVDPAVSTGDREIVIAGHAVERRTGLPLAEAPLKVVITRNGFERTQQVLTDATGAFEYPFRPPAMEGGVYSVRAVHPEVLDKTVQAWFTVNRVNVVPEAINISMPRNYEQSAAVQVRVSEGTELHHLRLLYEAGDQPAGAFPEGVHVNLGTPVVVVGTGQTVSLGFKVWADNTATGTPRVVLRVTSDEKTDGAWAMVSLLMNLAEGRPVLSFSPDHIETGSGFGETVFETLTLENKGLADLNEVSLSLLTPDGRPAPGWVQLNTGATLGTIRVGEKRSVNLSFQPNDVTTVEGYHTFLVRVVSANHRPADIPVYVAVTQSGTGEVILKVSDIYTGTVGTNGRIVQGLKNAAVTLQHELVTSIQKSAATDDLGEVVIASLPTGRYRYRVSAANHQEQTGRIWVKAGVSTSETVFLNYHLVTVEWEVKEITIEDHYEVVLKVTYETDVPAAVLVAQPSSVYLPRMKAGDVYQGEFSLTNHGLIRADNLIFTLPSGDANFRYEFPGELPETIEAKGQLAIPYRVTRLTGNDEDASTSCRRTLQAAAVSYDYGCAGGARTVSSAPLAFLYDNGRCAGQPTVPGETSAGGSGGGGTWEIVVPSGGAGGGGGITPAPSPAPIQGAKCLPLPDRQEAMTGRSPTCPLDTQKDVLQEVGSAVNCALREFVDSAEDLLVKVPGGRIAVSRFFYGNQWRWEAVRNNLLFGMDALGQAVKHIDKGGVIYQRSAAQSSTPVFVHDTYRITPTENGFLWKDKHGEWQAFDPSGRLTAYGNPSGVVGKLWYGPGENGILLGIADRNDRQVIWFELDAQGRIAAVRDLGNRRVEYSYRDEWLTSVKDVLGNCSHFDYDAMGRMVKKTDAVGRVETISYDSYGNVASVVDDQDHGFRFEFDYDPGKKQYYARIASSAGLVKEVWYDRNGDTERVDLNGRTVRKMVRDGRNLLVIDERGKVTRKDFDEWKNLIRVVYADGATVSFEYEHTYNQRVSVTDERGVRTEYVYDASGNLIKKSEARGTPVQRETDYSHDPQGNPTAARRVGDAVTAEAMTVMEHDAWGNLTAITDAEGNREQFTHDLMGNVLTKTDARGKVWSTTYDAAGRPTRITDPLGHATAYAYDAAGNRVREVDAEGREKTFVHDGHHRLVSSTDAAGNTTRYEYNWDGRLIRQVDPEGKTVEYAYDSRGRLVKAIDGNANLTQIEYDQSSSGCVACAGPSDQPSKIIYPTFTREFRYDDRGRIVEELDLVSEAETISTSFSYDAAGNLTSTTDREGHTTTNGHDALNRLIRSTDAAGHETHFAYDSRDNLIALTDARGNTTRFTYDRNNRQVGEVRPMGQTTRYEYDVAGRLAGRIDAKAQRSEYAYDDVGRLTHVSYYEASDPATPAKSVAFGHDKFGHLVSYNDGITSASYEYDDAHRKILETVDYGSFQLSNTTAWYRNGTKKSFTGPDGITFSYQYDGNNQLMSFEIPEKGFITNNATAWNRPSLVTYPGGTVRQVTYDPLMRIRSIQVKDPAGEVLMDYGYSYDRMNNITHKATEYGDHVYRYDKLYRLVEADNPTLPDEAYTYDPAGNRLTSADVEGQWSYNANNELLTYDGVSYTYDENGNTIQKSAGGETIIYRYDVQDRLIRVESGSGILVAQYYYDPFGRRLWKEVGTEKICYAYADEGLIGEFDANGHQTKAYGYRPGSTWTTDPLFMKDGGQYYFYHNDHLGTPMQLAAESGAVVWSAQYGSFGHWKANTHEVNISELRFSGQYCDQETDLNYNYLRYYNKTIGRYISQDPSGLYSINNLYNYCDNNPIIFTDFYGLFTAKPHEIITSNVLAEYGANDDSVKTIVYWNNWVDRPSNQLNNDQHGLRNIGQSHADAGYANKAFYRNQLKLAISAMIECRTEDAFSNLGQGLHAVQDKEAHDLIVWIRHGPDYLYRDKYVTEEKLMNATTQSKRYIEVFINAVGCNPFKNKNAVISSDNPFYNKSCCCDE